MLHPQPPPYSILHRKEVPDGLLVGQALAGDHYAFEFLVNRYHHPLVSYIRGLLTDNDQISDVLQQVYLQLYLSLPILLRDVSLKAWLFQVTDLRGNWADTQHAGDDREDLLLPLFAALAESARKQRAICIDFVEYLAIDGGHQLIEVQKNRTMDIGGSHHGIYDVLAGGCPACHHHLNDV
jgi:hypothetical protein